MKDVQGSCRLVGSYSSLSLRLLLCLLFLSFFSFFSFLCFLSFFDFPSSPFSFAAHAVVAEPANSHCCESRLAWLLHADFSVSEGWS